MKLHPKYGVNPTMTRCYVCGEIKEILLIGNHTAKLKKTGIASKDGKMPSEVGVINKEPCNKCKEYMEQGVILISVYNGSVGDNPYRTGGWIVIKREAAKRIFGDKVDKVMFVEDELWDKVGLPREEIWLDQE